MRIDVVGVGFDSLTMDEAVARARDLMAERRAAYVVTPNPEIVMLCREDPAAMQAVQGADLVLPDGIGVIYGAKILGTPLRAKLPGIDFASALMACSESICSTRGSSSVRRDLSNNSLITGSLPERGFPRSIVLIWILLVRGIPSS